jgi:DNA-binding NtrC family response regulator
VADDVAAGNATVLITGEPGVGKNLIARYIHARSPRAQGSLVTLDCAAFTDPDLEGELFGRRAGENGNGPGASGRLRAANQGTLVLEHVGEMSPHVQRLLVRVIERGEDPLASDHGEGARLDLRVIATTTRDLEIMLPTGQFRLDLLDLLRIVHIRVPPLRQRTEDIRPIVRHFISRTERAVGFTEAALQVLERHRWPGNVRELRNVVEQLVWRTAADEIDVQHLPGWLTAATARRVNVVRDRRRTIADDLYVALISRHAGFWQHVHPIFLERDMTRHDLRELVRRGLATTNGNYRAVLRLFGMGEDDYKRFMNFLAAHDCRVDYRPFRAVRLDADTGLRPDGGGVFGPGDSSDDVRP